MSAHQKLIAHVERLVASLEQVEDLTSLKDRLLADLPRGWDRYTDFILLPENSEGDLFWLASCCDSFLKEVNKFGRFYVVGVGTV